VQLICSQSAVMYCRYPGLDSRRVATSSHTASSEPTKPFPCRYSTTVDARKESVRKSIQTAPNKWATRPNYVPISSSMAKPVDGMGPLK
jgi:hypothetical protein